MSDIKTETSVPAESGNPTDSFAATLGKMVALGASWALGMKLANGIDAAIERRKEKKAEDKNLRDSIELELRREMAQQSGGGKK